ncbi:zinc-ribbon domain-containing protein [Candidatus Bathyarchaeota archaeon]|nr:MAG: zinc-ribbon domain-containing protein [Candidatus Bathyarchaeota archaeon]
MICPNCGKEVPDDANFCKYCGIMLAKEKQLPTQDIVRNILIRRIEGIRNRDSKAIKSLVDQKYYTKFDDWPPFDLQESEALENEAKALKVLKEYEYETRNWKIQIFGDSAIATFIIVYRGQIRDLKFNIKSRVSAFLLKRNGEWKIIHEHWSRFPLRYS